MKKYIKNMVEQLNTYRFLHPDPLIDIIMIVLIYLVKYFFLLMFHYVLEYHSTCDYILFSSYSENSNEEVLRKTWYLLLRTTREVLYKFILIDKEIWQFIK